MFWKNIKVNSVFTAAKFKAITNSTGSYQWVVIAEKDAEYWLSIVCKNTVWKYFNLIISHKMEINILRAPVWEPFLYLYPPCLKYAETAVKQNGVTSHTAGYRNS